MQWCHWLTDLNTVSLISCKYWNSDDSEIPKRWSHSNTKTLTTFTCCITDFISVLECYHSSTETWKNSHTETLISFQYWDTNLYRNAVDHIWYIFLHRRQSRVFGRFSNSSSCVTRSRWGWSDATRIIPSWSTYTVMGLLCQIYSTAFCLFSSAVSYRKLGRKSFGLSIVWNQKYVLFPGAMTYSVFLHEFSYISPCFVAPWCKYLLV